MLRELLDDLDLARRIEPRPREVLEDSRSPVAHYAYSRPTTCPMARTKSSFVNMARRYIW
jgi:hypothetical protein